MTIKAKRHLIALVITVVMAFSLVLPMASATGKLAAPVLLTDGEPLLTADGNIQNPARHTQFRFLLFEEIEGATGYDVYAFRTRDDALTGDASLALAVARNQSSTEVSQSQGGTQATDPVKIGEGQIGIDVRLLQYEELVEGTTRVLPEEYTPAGLGDSYMPGTPNTGDTTNLKPGQYWFTVTAVDSEDESRTSDMAEPHEDAFSIAVGPDEALSIFMPRIDELGNTPDATLRLIDLRGSPEFGDEGVVRFFEDRIIANDFNTTEKAEAIFGHVDDKDAVTIFVMCRGGGRTVSAVRHLSAAGYYNVYNMQGVNQWKFGLMYNDPEFRWRIFDGVEHIYGDGYLNPPMPPGVDWPEGIGYDSATGVLRWFNIPRAVFKIYAFESETETDPANAIATGTLPDIALDVSGGTRDHRWVRKFALAELGLPAGDYFIRLQATPDAIVPIPGMDGMIFGEPSELSDALEYTSFGPFPFADVLASDWFYDNINGVLRTSLMKGLSDDEFVPLGNLSLAQAITMAVRTAGTDPGNSEEEDGEWFDYYVADAIEYGIINEDDFSDYTALATRAQMAYIFANVLPSDINGTIERTPPDVQAEDNYADEILLLYSLGVLTGSDDEGTFYPNNNITRAEAATILLRISRLF